MTSWMSFSLRPRELTQELGKIEGLDSKQRDSLYEQLALAAIKFFLVKVDPRKDMVFNPEESISLNGHSGPFVQYAYARTQSIQEKAAGKVESSSWDITTPIEESLHEEERRLLLHLYHYPKALADAAECL